MKRIISNMVLLLLLVAAMLRARKPGGLPI
jgi:hypothetical protein